MDRKVLLKDISKITSGSAAPKTEFFTTKGIPFIRAGHLKSLIDGIDINNLPKISSNSIKLKTVEADSILFAKSGMSCLKNRVYKTHIRSYFVSHLASIKPDSEVVNTDYLKYFIEWYKPSTLVKDESYPSIRMSDISNIEIVLPDLVKQTKIAGILNKSNEIMKLRKKQISTLSTLKHSVFSDMFDNPTSNKKGFITSVLGEHTSLVTSGSTPRGGSKSYVEEGIPLIRSQNVLWNEFFLDNVVYIPNDLHTNMKRSQLLKKDVLFNITGASIGRSVVYEGENNLGNVNQHVSIIRLKSSLNPYFLSYFLTSNYFQSNIVSKNIGATRQAFNYTQIKEFNILLPEIQLQNKFEEKIKTIDKQINILVKSQNELLNLNNALIQKSFKDNRLHN